MRRQELEYLRVELRRGGVSRRYIERTIEELADHYADLEADALEAGCSADEAAQRADESLGSGASIAAAVLERAELKGFAARWPRLSSCMQAMGALAAYRAAPVHYLVDHGPDVARWSVSTGLSLLLTWGLLLTLSTALQV